MNAYYENKLNVYMYNIILQLNKLLKDYFGNESIYIIMFSLKKDGDDEEVD
jgi:hypothetical protein